MKGTTYFSDKGVFVGDSPYHRDTEAVMETSNSRSAVIAFFALVVLAGAAFAFVVGKHVGGSLDHHGRNVTVGHDRAPTATSVAQK